MSDTTISGTAAGRAAEPFAATCAWLGLGLTALAAAIGLISVSPHVTVPPMGTERVYTASAASMEPLIRVGERFLVNSNYYATHEPRRGDVVVYTQPERRGEVGFKRIAALGGDRIALMRGIAVVNGAPADEPYAKIVDPASAVNNVPETIVPQGFVFVLGDNRDNSEDSRSTRTHGLVPLDNIVSAATYMVWSPDVRRIGKWIGTPPAL